MRKIEKDCIFLLADKQMEYAFKGFLERENFHRRIGTQAFTYEIIVDSAGNDPGVYTKGHELLRPFYRTHRHAIIVLDQEWQGAPDASKIRKILKERLCKDGWSEEDVEVIVIAPELDIWLWQDSPHIARAFKFDHAPHKSLREWLEKRGLWEATDLKPAYPKKAFECVCRATRMPRSSALYQQITRHVSVRGCTDPAFCLLWETLKRWFPISDYDVEKG